MSINILSTTPRNEVETYLGRNLNAKVLPSVLNLVNIWQNNENLRKVVHSDRNENNSVQSLNVEAYLGVTGHILDIRIVLLKTSECQYGNSELRIQANGISGNVSMYLKISFNNERVVEQMTPVVEEICTKSCPILIENDRVLGIYWKEPKDLSQVFKVLLSVYESNLAGRPTKSQMDLRWWQMKIQMCKPDFTFKPISVSDLKINGGTSQVTLKIIDRFCDLDLKNKMLYFYFKVGNSKSQFIIPVKYYEFLCASSCDRLYCQITKVSESGKNTTILSIASFDKPILEIRDNIENAISSTNNTLPKHYCKTFIEDKVYISKVLDSSPLITTVGKAWCKTGEENYSKIMCGLDSLLAVEPLKLKYRKLAIDNVIYKTDMEAIV